MSTEGKPYEFLEVEGGFKVILRRPQEIIRCSTAELFGQLRAYSGVDSDWRVEGCVLVAVFDLVDSRSSRHLREVVSAAFLPRSSSRSWKDW